MFKKVLVLGAAMTAMMGSTAFAATTATTDKADSMPVRIETTISGNTLDGDHMKGFAVGLEVNQYLSINGSVTTAHGSYDTAHSGKGKGYDVTYSQHENAQNYTLGADFGNTFVFDSGISVKPFVATGLSYTHMESTSRVSGTYDGKKVDHALLTTKANDKAIYAGAGVRMNYKYLTASVESRSYFSGDIIDGTTAVATIGVRF